MSAFPYSQISPPPTAGPLPVIERANQNTPYSGGGGGGGGGAISTFNTASISSLSVSSINGAAPGGGGSIPAALVVSSLFVNDGFYGSGGGGIEFLGGQDYLGYSIVGSAGGTPNYPGFTSSILAFAKSPGGFPLFSDFGAGRLVLLGQTNSGSGGDGCVVGPGIIQVGDGNSTTNNDMLLYSQGNITLANTGVSTIVCAGGTAYISSIVCSTINGAAPGGGGGGGPPPAATSTILALTNLSSINNGTPQLLLVAGDVGITGGYLAASAISTNQISPLQGAQLSISTIGGTQTILQMSGDSGGYIELDAGQSEGTITLKAYSTIITNDLNVSSINGSAYPPTGSALQFSTLNVPGGPGASTFVCDPAVANVLVSFSTIAGHVYSATTYARAQVFEAATNGQVVYTEILDDNTGNDPIGNWPAQAVSTLAAGGGYQQVGGSVTWKAGGTGAAFCVVPDVSTLVRVDGINLMDFGAV